ncbi:MarR family winged helix-turn-helix transcriptional regulator [Novosphingobium sp. UBA1939]|uniref:MarR family winged helix-turn-helix transcriptional regulator n=1 Tax=Novosphingobium sp. UBA1939 TaxID=1946982 RepID=UPI0025DBA48C|nr:MarR family winged helix-turn-helix transcriptional regulator [Novosphingobium sp. UBA1939]
MVTDSKADSAGNTKTEEPQEKVALPPESSVAFQIRRAHLAFDRLLSMRLARHGIKSGYYNYLRALWIKDRVTQRDLSDATRVTETTTVALLKGMDGEGLIERVRDSVDKRKILVTLTPLGRSLEPEILPHAAELNEIATRGIDAAEIRTFIKVARKIAANLEKAFGESD